MNRLIAIALASTLVGCTVDNSDSCTAEHSYTYAQTDGAGLTLEPSAQMFISFEHISAAYQEVQACLGLTAPGPTVEYVDYQDEFNGAYGSPWAGYISPGLVFMNTNMPHPFVRDCDTDSQAIRHEFVHHILDANGLDKSHSNPLFQQCYTGVNISN